MLELCNNVDVDYFQLFMNANVAYHANINDFAEGITMIGAPPGPQYINVRGEAAAVS